MSETVIRDRFRGCLLGLAVGDALGTTLEFKHPGSFEPINDIVGGGPFHLEPGEWTDDTSMALCLATSLLECDGFDPTDQMQRYVRWWREGYLSSTGECFDIGNTVRAALSRFIENDDPFAGSTDPMSAGNGSLMRLAPVPMYYASNAAQAIDMAADSSRGHAPVTRTSRCLPLLRWSAHRYLVRSRQGSAALCGLLPRRAALAAGSPYRESRGRRGRIVQGSRTASHQRNRLRCRCS